jgi:hypothetical protein
MSGRGNFSFARAALIAAGAAAVVAGCEKGPTQPATPAETQAAFTYVPLDPLPVEIAGGAGCEYREGSVASVRRAVLDSLPDNAVRVAIRQVDGTASGSIGPAKLGAEGHQYQVILDYINADVVNLRFRVTRDKDGRVVRLERLAEGEGPRNAGEAYEGAAPAGVRQPGPVPGPASLGDEVVIPVYVGVGLRLTANVKVLKGNVNLSSLGALAAQAEAQNIAGSLIVQTLGITGKQVTTALPLPSELNQTTIQNAILALGSIKAIVYDQQGTVIWPRVTGIYNPLGASDERTLNSIVSEIARSPVVWKQPCKAA